MCYSSEQHTHNYVHACLSFPAGTQIIPPAPYSPTTVAPDGETSTSSSMPTRAQPETSESTKAACQ